MKSVEIFSDGSCTLTDNGRGGYGAVILHGEQKKEIYGGMSKTTNNRAELYAVIFALEALKEGCNVTVYSDSKYVVDAFCKKWIVKWFAKGFDGVKNPDLWRRLLQAMARHRVTYVWVKGHAGIAGNERADELATIGASMAELPLDRRDGSLGKILLDI